MPDDFAAHSLRRERIVAPSIPRTHDLGPTELDAMIPHRDPFRLIDGIDHYDASASTIRGHRAVAPDDPVFAGHFPGEPVYPGVLLLEMLGQLGLCLLYLDDTAEAGSAGARLLKVHHATFLAPVVPGAALTLEARALESDAITASIAGQVWHADTLCAVAILEVYLA